MVEHGRKNGELLGTRYFELRYEDLVTAPRALMEKIFNHAQLPWDRKFIDDNYPETLENRNYKWEADRREITDDGFTAHRAFAPEDMPFLSEMTSLLQELGYETE